ncbi:hypothetical protein Sjap_009303 [Stephania japonica]|uniref:ASCH domain-containing protein n=1 Tax=Stephania japonica TaxID=461633 RepID=A0AAP0JRW5_9MAGN
MEEEDEDSGVSPVSLSHRIEDLLRFLLESSIEETLDVDLGLSKDYCSDLLKDDDLRQCELGGSSTSEGVPLYPLYKSVASALSSCIASGSFVDSSINMIQPQENEILLKEKDKWNRLILEKGSELARMLEASNFELHVQEPFFSQLRVGQKTIEGRCAVGDYKRIGPGALLVFNKCLVLEVQDVRRYASFYEMLMTEGLGKVLPGVKKIEEGVQIYRNFYSEEKEKTSGVLAICVSKLAFQPYITLGSIISGLSYEGVGELLGLKHTAGTIHDALPPPRSVLLSSFQMPYRQIGSTLSVGARALAKHVERCSSQWWGSFDGNDCDKNRIALRVIDHLINHCCWINVHVVQPYGAAFEIRVVEGYGARWSKDGMKFIGFLEPYMEEGFSKRWKH